MLRAYYSVSMGCMRIARNRTRVQVQPRVTNLAKPVASCMHMQLNDRSSISSIAFQLASNPLSHSPSPSNISDGEPEAENSGYTGLLAYPFGLLGIENTIESYRSSPSASTAASHLDSLCASLATERHAIELDSALQQKGVFQGEAIRRASAGNGQQQAGSGFEELASRVDLLQADITNLETDGILLEKYQKTFVLYRPDVDLSSSLPSSSSSPATPSPLPTADGLRFVCSWFTQQHPARRELATYAFHATIRLTPFNVESESGEMREVGNALRLFDVSECDSTRNDVQLFQAIYQSYAGKGVTEKEFAWFISFLASQPSDRAVSPKDQVTTFTVKV